MRVTAPAAEDALVERLDAALDGVRVGPLPTEIPTEQDRVYIIGVEGLARSPRTEQGAKLETYLIVLWVEVQRFGATSRSESRNRGWELVDLIDADLVDDDELADVVDDSALEGVPEMNTLPTDDGWITKGIVHVRVNATV
jgi:hypothetical protein